MAQLQSFANDLNENFDDKLTASSTPQKSNALSNKISSVLSASYADAEIRDALRILDEKSISNSAETRRSLRLDIQKEVIERNGNVIKDFGRVAEVGFSIYIARAYIEDVSAIEKHWHNY